MRQWLELGTDADAFRLLTGGIKLPGPYRGRSVVFKELERRADHVFKPENGEGPVYVIEIQAQPHGAFMIGWCWNWPCIARRILAKPCMGW